MGSLLVIILLFIIFYSALLFIRKVEKKEVPEPKINQPKEKDIIEIGACGNRKVLLPSNIKHAFICGTTGTGKTVALSNFIKSGIDNNYPMAIIDGKGDCGKDSILDIIMTLKKDRKVYVVNMNSPNESDLYNPFYDTTPTIIKDMLINLTTWSEEHYKLNMERYLQRLINTMVKAKIPLSLETIMMHISPDDFAQLSQKLTKDEIITKQEHISNMDMIKASGKISEGAIARFSTLVESDLGCIFSSKGIDVFQAFQENAIILFILNPLIYPELTQLMGKLAIIDIKKAVSKLFHAPFKRSYFIFDEVNVYASNHLLDLVNKSRSANGTCILAAQSLSDLDAAQGESFREQIIENCNNYILLRQNSPKNADIWANIIGTKESVAITRKYDNNNKDIDTGSVRMVREYIFHPDDIKTLSLGKGFLVSKDVDWKGRVSINKPF